MTNRIALRGTDGQIRVRHAAGDSEPVQLTTSTDRRAHVEPVWSPDGELLAWSDLDPTDAGSIAHVTIAAGDGSFRAEIPLTFAAFYLHWRPDSRAVAALSNGPLGLELSVIDLATEQTEIITRGAPLFWDWSSDGDLVTHVGPPGEDRVELIPVDQQSEPSGDPEASVVPVRPGRFSAPARDPRGAGVLVPVDVGTHTEVVTLTGREISDRIVACNGLIRLVADPAGGRIALLAQHGPDEPGFIMASDLPVAPANRPLIVDHATGATDVIDIGPPVAMQWNPVRDELLLLRADELGGATWLRWWINRPSGLEPYDWYRPTPTMARHLPFAEQYERSHRWFLSDGSGICFAGRLVDGRSGAFVRYFDEDEATLLDSDVDAAIPSP